MDMDGAEARFRVLEEIAASTKQALIEIRTDLRELRTSISAELREVRQHQERDFRILFGAIIASTLGLAWLIARGKGWF